MQEKLCKVCEESKSLDKYYHAYSGKYGRRSICITCFNTRRKNHYKDISKASETIKCKEWSVNNKDKRNECTTRWRVANKPRKAVLERIRKTKHRQATPSWLTEEQKEKILWYYQLADILRKQGIICQVDHVVPLLGKDVCGLHVPWNLMVTTKEENVRKGNRPLTR